MSQFTHNKLLQLPIRYDMDVYIGNNEPRYFGSAYIGNIRLASASVMDGISSEDEMVKHLTEKVKLL